MEESPSKRRKLSPPGDDNAPDANYGRPREASPAKQRGSWSSWLSPTKASLARFNPSLLPRPSPSKSPTPRSPARQKSLEPGALRSPTRPDEPTLTSQGTRAASASPRRSAGALGGGFAVGARRQSRGPGRSPGPVQPESPGTLPETIRDERQPGPETQLAVELQASTKGERTSLSARPRRPRRTEPDLPPTPEQLGMKPLPAQPQGLLSSSPTARASRRKATAKSSPLKEREPPVERVVTSAGDADKENVEPEHDQQVTKALEDPATLRKRDELRRLQNQLQFIRNDVSYLEKAVTSLQDTGFFGFVTESKVRSLLTTKDPHHERIFLKRQVHPLSNKLAQFLPFSRPQRQQAAAAALDALDEHPLHDAYRPVEAEQLSIELGVEPQVEIQTREQIVSESLSTNPLRSKRRLAVHEPSGLFSMDLELTINNTDDTIAAIDFAHLSPWAEAEFGVWARPAFPTGDLPALGRAFGEYWSLNVLRAKTWARCNAEFASLLHDPSPQSTSNLQDSGASSSRAVVHAHLGRRDLQFSRNGASLLIQWEIDLDWTGAANSVVSASCALPASWRDADERGSFALVGPAFKRLVEERGVMEAVKIMIRTILGEDSG